jgi:hypothetical protein
MQQKGKGKEKPMLQLLQTFPPSQLVIFIILLALAFKEVVTFILWLKDLIMKRDNSKEEKTEEQKSRDERLTAAENDIKELKNAVSEIKGDVKLLIVSDRDDIKADITKDHHYFCYHLHWIDDYSMDCLERRYKHYVDEDGNSFISQLMDELRALPKKPADSHGEL